MDDAFTKHTNDIGSDLFFRCAQLQRGHDYSDDEVVVGLALALSQRLAGSSFAPSTIRAVTGCVASGLQHTGSAFEETIADLDRRVDEARQRPLPPDAGST